MGWLKSLLNGVGLVMGVAAVVGASTLFVPGCSAVTVVAAAVMTVGTCDAAAALKYFKSILF